MNKRVKKLWIKALRSGKFRKTKNMLRSVSRGGNESYCCLGVLTELYRREIPRRGKWLEDSAEFIPAHDPSDSNSTELPQCVQRWAGLGKPDPELGVICGSMRSAAGLNDGGKSFNYIADRIEKYL